MDEIRLNVYIHAPAERVFDVVADHESFLRTTSGIHTKVVRPGVPDRDGLGCLREVRSGRSVRFLEEITAWSRPRSFDYRILESTFRVRHHGGRLGFTPRGEGTEVEWTSRFELPIPLVGRVLEPLARRNFTALFHQLLLVAKAKLEAEHAQRAP